jgi:toxin-antitoxin system PIN domain toxin
MMLVDANLLLYAKIADYPQHPRARHWLDQQLNGESRVALPWPSLLAFVRIASNPRIFPQPLSVEVVWKQVEEWLQVPVVWTPVPLEDHARTLATLMPYCRQPGLIQATDLAALALGYGLVICSSDADFARFPGVRWVNPLAH